MAATQISFVAFAQSLCPPPVTEEAAAPVVAHELVGGDSGECTELAAYRADFLEFRRLTALADETVMFPFKGWSRGGFVLASLGNYRAPCDSEEDSARLLSNLRYQAMLCIGEGC